MAGFVHVITLGECAERRVAVFITHEIVRGLYHLVREQRRVGARQQQYLHGNYLYYLSGLRCFVFLRFIAG